MYIHVATRTVEEPNRKPGVIWKSNNTTDAKKDRIMEREVAKPLRMLSEYLMTIAVTSPPNTWIATVAHAQIPKFLNRSPKIPCDDGEDNDGELAGRAEKRMGSSAGRSEKKES